MLLSQPPRCQRLGLHQKEDNVVVIEKTLQDIDRAIWSQDNVGVGMLLSRQKPFLTARTKSLNGNALVYLWGD